MATRPDVEYVVYSQRGGEKVVYKRWSDACAAAVSGSLASGDANVIDVYVRTVVGAQRFAGEDGVRRFRELADPERVFERVEVRADLTGVPS